MERLLKVQKMKRSVLNFKQWEEEKMLQVIHFVSLK
jgi:hypothetical protein